MLHSVQLPYHLVWVGGLETISSQRLISGFVVGRLAESQAGSLLSNFSTFLGQTPHPNFRGGGAAISIERGCIPCPADSRHGTPLECGADSQQGRERSPYQDTASIHKVCAQKESCVHVALHEVPALRPPEVQVDGRHYMDATSSHFIAVFKPQIAVQRPPVLWITHCASVVGVSPRLDYMLIKPTHGKSAPSHVRDFTAAVSGKPA